MLIETALTLIEFQINRLYRTQVDHSDKPIDSRYFTKNIWKEVLEWKGIEYRVQYNTRHSFITHCLEAGIQVAQVAAWVGNSPQTIWTYYAGVTSGQNVPDV